MLYSPCCVHGPKPQYRSALIGVKVLLVLPNNITLSPSKPNRVSAIAHSYVQSNAISIQQYIIVLSILRPKRYTQILKLYKKKNGVETRGTKEDKKPMT